jgi:hypothetical protein
VWTPCSPKATSPNQKPPTDEKTTIAIGIVTGGVTDLVGGEDIAGLVTLVLRGAIDLEDGDSDTGYK